MLKRLLAGMRRRDAANAAVASAEISVDQAVRLLQLRDTEGAARVCEQLLLRDPGAAKVWELLGVIALNQANYPLACERFEKVLALGGGDAQQLANAAEANRRADHPARALELIDRALALRSGHAPDLHIRVLALQDCWRIEEALDACRAARQAHPDFEKLHTTYLQLLNCVGADAAQIRAAHGDWARRFAAGPAGVPRHSNPRQAQRRLRIGYVSGDFRTHAISEFLLPLLQYHDRDRFDVYCYSNTVWTDGITQRCESLAANWRDISVMSDAAAEALIRADAIDILIDLSGHSMGNRLHLFARKPAPVQATYIGYPGTTGLTQVDFRVTDAWCDPPGSSEASYGERLLRVPHSLWCYQTPGTMPVPSPAPFLRAGHISFGSVNSMAKLTPGMIALWSQVLLSVPGARMVMASVPEGAGRARILAEFEKNGVPATALSMVPTLPREKFWALFAEIDIALDSFPYNGGATTCATLWMGVPVITLVGELFQSRAGLSILSTAGLSELAAQDPAALLRIARKLALDRARLQRLRAGMRERLLSSPLADCERYTRDLEGLYHGMWEAWCAKAIEL